MTAEDGIIVLSTVRAADDSPLLKGSPTADVAKLNGVANHVAPSETELVKLAGSQHEASAMPARASPSSAAPAAAIAIANGMSTSDVHHPDARRLPELEPPLRPQLLQRMQTLREALDGQQLKGPQRSEALRAFAMLCLACSPPSTASQVCA